MPRGFFPALVLALAVCGTTGCAARDPVGGAITAGRKVYPAGTPRAELRRPGDARAFVLTDEPPDDRFAAAVVARQATRGLPRPRSYETFDVMRRGPMTSVGIVGWDQDYVFYDGVDRVVYAARRYLD